MGERLRVELARSRDIPRSRGDDRRGDRGRYDRGGGGGGGGGRYGDRDRRRGGNPPGPRTKYRLVVDNLASRTSWQVRERTLNHRPLFSQSCFELFKN